MKNINNKDYELINNYKDAFDLEETISKCTDYFDAYDYIVGDWSYGKLRLKGFCDSSNKLCSNINCIDLLDEYIKNNCSYDCRYFVLKKVV